jgi:hypothetical protein
MNWFRCARLVYFICLTCARRSEPGSGRTHVCRGRCAGAAGPARSKLFGGLRERASRHRSRFSSPGWPGRPQPPRLGFLPEAGRDCVRG